MIGWWLPGLLTVSCEVSWMRAGSALLSVIEDDIVQGINDYSAQQVTVALWAFGKLETASRPVLMQVSVYIWCDRILSQCLLQPVCTNTE